ncbi:MAG: hypothetical protein JWO22_2498 [Frankiales bacterium]|nr:hypothetical protein [Frankiales bacterium]
MVAFGGEPTQERACSDIVIASRLSFLLVGAAASAVLVADVGVAATWHDTRTPAHVAAPAPSASPSPSAGPLASGTRAAGQGVSLRLAPGWTVTPRDTKDYTAFLTRVAKDNPKLAAELKKDLALAARKNYAVHAIGQPVGTNLNVQVQGVGIDVDVVAPTIKAQLTKVGGTGVRTSPVELPAGHALKVDYRLRLAGILVYGTQYYVSNGSLTAILTFTLRTPGPAQVASMMSTFAFD